MQDMVARLDEWGQPAWITLLVVSFVVFWPIGLAVLFYMIWSGRMGCGRRGRRSDWQQRMAGKFERKMSKWGMQAKAYQPTGNEAFDEYREETLRRLEEEADEFNNFLERLRKARDRQQFEDFMRDRRNRQARPSDNGAPSTGGGSVPPMDPAPAT
jgi:hypothetical protein